MRLGDHTLGQALTTPLRSMFGNRPGDVRNTSSSSVATRSSQSQSFVSCLAASPARSLYTSTPRSRRDHDIPSPHTFGPESKLVDDAPYFTFKENPPPLPPLNHPAFRNTSTSQRHEFPRFPDVDDDAEFYARHSLPSLTRSRSATRPGTSSAKKRPRSKSSVTGNSNHEQQPSEATHQNWKRTHARNTSIATQSSRRSSAEYSAKQASSIGHVLEPTRDECWEVQVSKQMVRLALGLDASLQDAQSQSQIATVEHHQPCQLTPQDAYPPLFGTARGKNQRWTGGSHASRLGSPFLLHDTYQLSTDTQSNTNDITSAHFPTTRPPSGAQQNGRFKDMSNGASMILPPTSSSAHTRKTRQAPASPSPQPRRGVARAASSPSDRQQSRTPSPPPGMGGSYFGSMHAHDPPPSHAVAPGTSSGLLAPPSSVSITSPPTPQASPSRKGRMHHKSTPTMPTTSVLRTPYTPPILEKSYSTGSGKRKADEAGVGGDKTPPKEPREQRATFAPEPRTHRASATSGSSGHAPSSFNRSKRVRLTNASEGKSSMRSNTSRPGSSYFQPEDSPPNAKTTGSWSSSRGSVGLVSASSHTHRERPSLGPTAGGSQSHANSQRAQSRRSLSQASIPISALISPHAPSISHSGTFHMRDPRKPSPIQRTPWTLSLPSQIQKGESRWELKGWVERGGSPLHAWAFFVGFVVFPLWWAAALVVPIPQTRHLAAGGGGEDVEKGVMLDDPQVEHDSKSWRTRCRVMAVVSLVTYIPFIVLVAIYA